MLNRQVEAEGVLGSTYHPDKKWRPTVEQAIGAVLLDFSGLVPADLRRGVTVIRAPEETHQFIVGVIKTVFDDLIPGGVDRWGAIRQDCRLIYCDDAHSTGKDGWVLDCLGRGAPIVLVTVDGTDHQNKLGLRLRDRMGSCPTLDDRMIIPNGVRVWTGADLVVAPEDFTGTPLVEVVAAMPGIDPRPGAVTVVDRLRLLRSRRGQDDLSQAVGLGTTEHVSAPLERVRAKVQGCLT